MAKPKDPINRKTLKFHVKAMVAETLEEQAEDEWERLSSYYDEISNDNLFYSDLAPKDQEDIDERNDGADWPEYDRYDDYDDYGSDRHDRYDDYGDEVDSFIGGLRNYPEEHRPVQLPVFNLSPN